MCFARKAAFVVFFGRKTVFIKCLLLESLFVFCWNGGIYQVFFARKMVFIKCFLLERLFIKCFV